MNQTARAVERWVNRPAWLAAVALVLATLTAGHHAGRRETVAAAEAAAPAAQLLPVPPAPVAAVDPAGAAAGAAAAVAAAEEAFLDELQRRSFAFFREQADPHTSLVADRATADGKPSGGGVASIASTGFGLTALCVADGRGWIKHEEAYDQALRTLRFVHDTLPHERGFFYHFVDMRTGSRAWNCELSSIDTALLLAGVLTARQHFAGTEIEDLATKIYERVEWPWMLNGGKTLSLGWTPEGGFLPYRWDNFAEHLILYLLGLGSPTHPLPPESWTAWRREPSVTYAGRTFLQCPPLFTHQFPHAWVDFRKKRDGWGDYWQNSVDATLAHRQFCIDLKEKFPRYDKDLWGLTASDGPQGYVAWGGPVLDVTPVTLGADLGGAGGGALADRLFAPPIDGTVVPCAAAGSLPFAPEQCMAALSHMRQSYGGQVWKHYGFVDAFNPNTGWVASDVIGIDVGITLLMAENHRTGKVWSTFHRNKEINRAMEIAGFRAEE